MSPENIPEQNLEKNQLSQELEELAAVDESPDWSYYLDNLNWHESFYEEIKGLKEQRENLMDEMYGLIEAGKLTHTDLERLRQKNEEIQSLINKVKKEYDKKAA